MIINKNWKIETDSLNLTLLKLRVVQDGKNKGLEQWDADAYFAPTKEGFKSAIKRLADQEVAATELKDINVVLKKQEELYTLIEKMEVNNEL